MLHAAERLPGRDSVVARLPFVLWQTALVVLAVFVYFRVRGLTEGSFATARDHALDLVQLESWLGLDVEEDLQDFVAPSATAQAVANWIYIWGHWPVIIVTMMWLVWRHRVVFVRLRNAMLVSGALGAAVFVSYPVAPPRLAGLGMVDTVSDQSRAYRVLQPPAFVNQYAAMPSLHSGWDLLVGMAIFAAATSVALKVVGLVMPVLMGLAVVATANHYVVDVIAGVTLALIGQAVALWLERRKARGSVV
ncbi:phosphatase PAP2 family protein [Nocardioides sp. P5_C9_2]